MIKQTIQGSDEAWEDRTLGNDENFVKVVGEAEEASIDQSSGTQMISIRLQKLLIEDFKMIASLNGNIGYQTLMKQIMHRFVSCEKKRILNELVSEKIKEQQEATIRHEKRKTPRDKQRKAA